MKISDIRASLQRLAERLDNQWAYARSDAEMDIAAGRAEYNDDGERLPTEPEISYYGMIPPLYILKSVEALNIVTETLCSNDFQRLPAVCTIGRTQIHAYRPRRFRFTFHSAMLHQVDTAHDGTGFNCFPAVCPCLAYRAISHIAITPLKSGTQG